MNDRGIVSPDNTDGQKLRRFLMQMRFRNHLKEYSDQRPREAMLQFGSFTRWISAPTAISFFSIFS